MRRRLAAVLDRLGLLSPIARMREGWIARRASEKRVLAPDGLPMPPARIRVLVDGHGDADGFLADAAVAHTMMEATLARAGVELADLEVVLDFGCGCGRVARAWSELQEPQLHGCDLNPELTEWCSANLPFMEVRLNEAEPPSPYADDTFDLVYAVSILTHLTEDGAHRWIADFERILRPGGLLLITTHGDAFRERLTAGERARYDEGEVVVQRPRMAGRNACAAYHPPSYIAGRLLKRFEPVSFEADTVAPEFPQDVHLVRLRGD